MYRIAVCDDESTICAQIESIVLRYSEKADIAIDVPVYYSGEELYKELQRGTVFDLIFLDIELRVLNGIEVGKRIREELGNEIVQIVYISSKQGYAMDLFDVRPLHFLLKPIDEERIIGVIEKMRGLHERRSQFFKFQIGKEYYKIPLQKILYFESCGKKIHLISEDEIFEFYGKLIDVLKELDKQDFLWIHQSYIVHNLYIAKYRYESVTLINGKEFPISQPFRKEVREWLMGRRREGK